MVNRNGRVVTFVYRPQSKCRQVFLAGTFNDWAPRKDRMQRQKDGSFRKRLQLGPGHYEYKFVVDGVWIEDPEADGLVLNEFGTQNAVLAVS